MGQYSSYWLYERYITIGSQDPIPDYPNKWSIDADGTLSRILKLENDEACGYDPRPDPIYRWVNMDITKDYYCDECEEITVWEKSNETICVEDEPEPQYRTLTTATTCVTYDLHILEEHQVSYDGGVSWTTTSTTVGTLIEADSPTCGYVAPRKWLATYSDSHTESAECDSTSAITLDEITRSNIVSAEIGQCVTKLKHSVFYGCTSLTSVTIPNSVTLIDSNVFSRCSSLTNVVLPNSVTTIGDYAFDECTGLTSITIPDSVTSIGGVAFDNCRSLTSVNIPTGITGIYNQVFQNCQSLTSVTIPSGVTFIGQSAFRYCYSLTSITINATTPPTLRDQAFTDTNDCPIFVPAASVNTYKTASGWSGWASRIQAIP